MDQATMETMKANLATQAEILKAIAHPIRLCILAKLMQDTACNVSNLQSCVSAPQPTISQHLSKLRAAGIIEGRREGVVIEYRIVSDAVREIMRLLLQQ